MRDRLGGPARRHDARWRLLLQRGRNGCNGGGPGRGMHRGRAGDGTRTRRDGAQARYRRSRRRCGRLLLWGRRLGSRFRRCRGCGRCNRHARLRRRRLRFGFEQHAADQIRDLVGDDAELVFGLEYPAQSLVEERRQFLRGEPDLFGELENPYFSGQVSSRARGTRVPSVGVRGAPTDGSAPLSNQRSALIGGYGRHKISSNYLCHEFSIKAYSTAAAPRPG